MKNPYRACACVCLCSCVAKTKTEYIFSVKCWVQHSFVTFFVATTANACCQDTEHRNRHFWIKTKQNTCEKCDLMSEFARWMWLWTHIPLSEYVRMTCDGPIQILKWSISDVISCFWFNFCNYTTYVCPSSMSKYCVVWENILSQPGKENTNLVNSSVDYFGSLASHTHHLVEVFVGIYQPAVLVCTSINRMHKLKFELQIDVEWHVFVGNIFNLLMQRKCDQCHELRPNMKAMNVFFYSKTFVKWYVSNDKNGNSNIKHINPPRDRTNTLGELMLFSKIQWKVFDKMSAHILCDVWNKFHEFFKPRHVLNESISFVQLSKVMMLNTPRLSPSK